MSLGSFQPFKTFNCFDTVCFLSFKKNVDSKIDFLKTLVDSGFFKGPFLDGDFQDVRPISGAEVCDSL